MYAYSQIRGRVGEERGLEGESQVGQNLIDKILAKYRKNAVIVVTDLLNGRNPPILDRLAARVRIWIGG